LSCEQAGILANTFSIQLVWPCLGTFQLNQKIVLVARDLPYLITVYCFHCYKLMCGLLCHTTTGEAKPSTRPWHLAQI